ncbi:MAG: MBL fold metallo-hydrolase [Pseudomonadota bacterium]
MSKWKFTKGLHDLGNGIWAYLWPNGTWGFSNAGLIVDGNRSLLVDTLFDLASTKEMLALMRQATPAAASIDILVNTHGNGDHWYGNELVKEAEIIASKEGTREMTAMSPQTLGNLVKNAPNMGAVGEYIIQRFGPFKFDDITPTLPNITFEHHLDIKVGRKAVQLIEVGPAHTDGDLLVYVPENRVMFAGDILFVGGTPITWCGPISGWVKALNRILEMDVDTIVPGHGPITDKKGVQEVKDYLEYVQAETRKRFDAGMAPLEAALDIKLGKTFASWGDPDRLIVSVHVLYSEFKGEHPKPVLELFNILAENAKKFKG